MAISVVPVVLMSAVFGALLLEAAHPSTSTIHPKLNLPLAFERLSNSSKVRYVARGQGYMIAVDDANATIGVLPDPNQAGSMVTMQFAGGRHVAPVAGAELPGKVNYIRGNDPALWKLGVPTYGQVKYQDVYPGVDVVYYGNQQQLEFDLVLKPGVDPGVVRMKFEGARKVSLDPAGQLVLETPSGKLCLPSPLLYQESSGQPTHGPQTAGSRKKIAGHYTLRHRNEVGFEIGAYDRTKPLVIDPTIVGGALFGGNSSTYGQAIALDSSHNIYLAGYTYASDFPTTSGTAQPGYDANQDGFVSKINSTGTSVIYSTYLGGSQYDYLNSIAVDSLDAAWVTGYTSSPDFPMMIPYQSTFGGGQDAVLAKLTPTGTLYFSTYLGASGGYTAGYGVAVDTNNNAYVTGSSSGEFPTTAGVLYPSTSGYHAFVAKFNSSASILYATLLGGSSQEGAYAIAADASGNAYVTGYTYSSDFIGDPGGGARTMNAGNGDAFIAKLNPTGTAPLLYFTFLGGSSFDEGTSIKLDSSSPANAYVVGNTTSTDLHPTAGVVGGSLSGGYDGFVAKLNGAGSAFSYITYLGGSRSDFLQSLAVEPSSGDVYVTGYTESSNFPAVSPVEAFPSNPTSLFETTSGKSWSALDTNLAGAVISLSPDPVHSGTLVAATDAGIYRTTNSGSSWTLELNISYLGLSRSLANPSTLYAMDYGYSYLSTDNGVTWNSEGYVGTYVNTIIADPLSAGTAYSANTEFGSGIYVTTNSGSSWTPAADSGLGSGAIVAMVVAPNGTLYVVLDGNGVYSSTNNAASWTPINTGLPSPIYFNNLGNILTVSPGTSGNVLYLSYSNTVYKSTNGGASWALTTASVPNGPSYVFSSPANEKLVYATSNESPVLYVSSNGGTTWAPAATNLGLASITGVVFNPHSSTGAYALATISEAAFVAKLSSTATSFVYSTFLGSSSYTEGYGVATNGSGEAYVTGYTSSIGFPISSALPAPPNSFDGFVVVIADATAPCSYTIYPETQTIQGYLQTVTLGVNAPSGCAWTAVSNQSWAPVIGGASGTAAGLVTVQATANTTGATRSASIVINSGTATLNQAANSCSYPLSSYSTSLGSSGGPQQITVTPSTGCPWTVVNNDPSVIVDVTPTSGSASSAINFTVLPNADLNSRYLSLQIGGNYYSITQAGVCVMSLNSTSFAPTAEGGSSFVGLTGAGGCSWNASSNSAWLSITSGFSGSGDGTVGYSIATNTGAARMGTLTIDGQAFTVNQAAGTVSPVSVSPGSGSGLTQTFTITFDDPNGFADLAVVNVLINSSLDGIGACYVAFAPSSAFAGYLYLVDDAGDGGYASGSPLALPSSSSLQNSQCTINGTGSSVSASGNTLTLTLAIAFSSGFTGNRVVYLAARNNSTGNSGWQALGTWYVPGGTITGPAVAGMAPGRSATTEQTYTLTFTDTNGFADLAVVNVLTNSSLDGIGACYVALAPASASSGYLYLVDDAGDGGYASGSPITLPTSSTLQNSQCTINGTGSSVSASGNTLTLTLAITFSSSFAGNQVFYLAARNDNTGNSGWQPVGSVTVP